MHSCPKVIKIMTNDSSPFLSAQHHGKFCQCQILPPFLVAGSSGTGRYLALFLRVLYPASQAALTADAPEGAHLPPEKKVTAWKPS